mgnify:CR=1 FL=1
MSQVPFEILLETSPDCENWNPIWCFPPSPGQNGSNILSMREFLSHIHIHFQTDDDGLITFPALDSPRPHLEFWLKGDVRSTPENLDFPYDVVMLRYEDMKIADNYRDLIIDSNPVERNGKTEFCSVFWAEGSYEKWVCFDDKLIHHYESDKPASYYGIFETQDLPLKGPCPFQ